MSLQTPQSQLFSAAGSHAVTPGANLRTLSQELLQVRPPLRASPHSVLVSHPWPPPAPQSDRRGTPGTTPSSAHAATSLVSALPQPG